MSKFNELNRKYNKKNMVFVYSGTLAIETVLLNENVKSGDMVLIPNNVCYRILTAILRVGATPLIVKPSNELIMTKDDFEKILRIYDVKAILAVHQFGLNVNIKELKKLCKKGEIIIEDIAQGWDINSNSEFGRYSDYIVTSMGKSKPLDFGLGGAILTNNNIMKNLDFNNIKSRYDKNKLIPYVLPSNISLNINKLILYANKRKKKNIEYAKVCIRNINNKKIKFYVVDDLKKCYWERFPIWTEKEEIYKKIIEIADQIKIQYEPEHDKLLEELPLLENKKFKYVNLNCQKRYFIFLKTAFLNKRKLKKFIDKINKI